MLTDAFADFSYMVKSPEANFAAELASLDADLDHYGHKDYGYSRQVFPLLRKAARWYVAGKLPWRALHAIALRLDLYYVFLEGTEESLIEDLRGYIKVKPTLDLRAKVGAICRRRRATATAEPPRTTQLYSPTMLIPRPPVSATTSTGVVLRLVK
jgi:hypothetical protein